MWAGGECRGVRFSAASRFQIGRITRPADGIEQQAGASLAATALDKCCVALSHTEL
jgi:hypothetical protein